MVSIKCSFSLLIIAESKHDVRVIYINSEVWGSETSLMSKLNKKEGPRVILYVEGKEVPYVVVKQGMGNFEMNLEDLKKSMDNRDGVAASCEENTGAEARKAQPQSTLSVVRNFSTCFYIVRLVLLFCRPLSQVNDALCDAVVSGFNDSEDVEEPVENLEPNFVDEIKLFLLIQKKPPVQFGINNQNLDNVYHGHVHSSYGLALCKWIWGAN